MSWSKGLKRYNGVEQDDEGAYVYYDEHIAALRRAKAEGVLIWTKKQPTEAGWYWFRKDENHCMEPIHVRIGIRELECKWGYIDMQSGEWAGPIASPLDARAAQIEANEQEGT